VLRAARSFGCMRGSGRDGRTAAWLFLGEGRGAGQEAALESRQNQRHGDETTAKGEGAP
jgi:hypothetical protein